MKVRELLERAKSDIQEERIEAIVAELKQRLIEIMSLERIVVLARKQMDKLLEQDVEDAIFDLE